MTGIFITPTSAFFRRHLTVTAVLCLFVISFSTVSAQRIVHIDSTATPSAANFTTLADFQQRSGDLIDWNATYVYIHNDDDSITDRPFRLSGSTVNWNYFVLIQSDNDGEARTITAADTRLFTGNNEYNNDGYAPILYITSDITFAGKRTGTDLGSGNESGGGITFFGGDLYIYGVTFLNNINGTSIDYYGNVSHGGGAVYVDGSYYGTNLYGSGSIFTSNTASSFLAPTESMDGGAINIKNSHYADLSQAVFTSNSATGNGGAISALDSDVDLTDAVFTGNTAEGYGGAVYFESNGGVRTLTLGAADEETSVFSGNSQNTSESNSITFGGTGSIDVIVDVEGTGILLMDDPMDAHDNFTLNITKQGDGIWQLGGFNDLTNKDGITSVAIKEGTLRLNGTDSNIRLNGSSANDKLSVESGAVLEVAENSDAHISTSQLSLQKGSTLELNGNLTVHAADDNKNNYTKIGSTITGAGNLDLIALASGGTVEFSGQTNSYSGDLFVGSGITLDLNADDSFITENGTITFRDDSALSIKLDGQEPLMKARNISIGSDVNLIVDGLYQDTEKAYVILESDYAISGDFSNAGTTSPVVDYISTSLEKSADRKQYLLTSSLTWNLTDGNAHGTFTVEEDTAPGKFTVGISLNPNYTSTTGWDGETLTKKGTGILILDAKNNIGDAIIKDGTLQLTHSEALNAKQNVLFQETADAKPILELNFQDTIIGSEYRFGTQVGDTNGAGTLVKNGDNTVLLTNTNNQYGDTEINEGVLAIASQDVLGSGKVKFTGGTLQYRSETANFDYNLAATLQGDVKLDTQKDMRITGGITGSGGLVKTGESKLTLAGDASYTGNTEVRQGTLTLEKSIGSGAVILEDGTVFQNTATAKTGSSGIANNFVLNASDKGRVINGNIIDTQEDLQIFGTFSGKGMLVKQGEKTLTLSGINTYEGGTQIDEGTIGISRKENLGTGDVIFNGGTLKNTAVISKFDKNIIVNRDKNAIFETAEDLTINGGTISGSGGLIKTGGATLALSGNHSYLGDTLVKDGTLAVDGKTYSNTVVESDAALRGRGTIAGDVKFESGSAYEWFAGHTLAEKDCLTVLGDVELNNTTFRAVTAGGTSSWFQYELNGQEVLKYSDLTGDKEFASIDNSRSPFYIFSLDYSEQGVVKVLAQKRSEVLGLSDGIAIGLNTAQRRAHRRPFDHIDFSFRNARYALPETLDGSWIRKHQQALETGGYRGQNTPKVHNAWGDIYFRGTQYDSTFFADDWKMCSAGFQGGYSFYADQNLEWGLTVGAECPELKNSGDKITMSDGYLGLYYGQRLQRNWEFKGYIGGGTQRYESQRFDDAYKYKTRYYGESFQTNIEFARPLRTPYFVLRPLAGFDLEYAQQEAAYENNAGVNSEHRYYSKASLTQLFMKVGLDFQRPIRSGDSYFGIAYSNMIAGDSSPAVGVYYPTAGMSGTIRAASLGQNIFTFRLGANHYLNGRDYSILYWNFTADEYADRAGGKGEFSGTVGYSHRF